ncbi:FAD binding domain-containing protein [Irregularibacter muris]|jgi:CO/xanthine dehydrogenase FAD-binding subunit|uniref:FAD binding domain-containing protein n=1 Tax=Irregularibacter muris TaxID=1796619 RepID=A0AAE3HEH4_9FIRM|nr:FAD binding domain-containing protein [Irregularibacter muris]MCR1899005.1 FAD binding domain-containing protein [Irregularibacter muris]
MIPFDFQYIRPESIDEAITSFQELDKEGLSPIFYGGGTEIITNARKQNLSTGAVIDIKGIPECVEHQEKDGYFIFGAGLPLTDIIEENLFPFFSQVCRPIADHTVRNKLTLGGNICGRLPYREAVLPLLLSDAEIVIAGGEGTRTVPISQAYNNRLVLKKGEFLVQIKIPVEAKTLPHFNRRREKQTAIDYPILHIAGVQKEGKIRLAISGATALTFRSEAMEDLLNNKESSLEDRISSCLSKLPFPIKSDQWSSAEYRRALLEKALFEMLASLEGVSL